MSIHKQLDDEDFLTDTLTNIYQTKSIKKSLNITKLISTINNKQYKTWFGNWSVYADQYVIEDTIKTENKFSAIIKNIKKDHQISNELAGDIINYRCIRDRFYIALKFNHKELHNT